MVMKLLIGSRVGFIRRWHLVKDKSELAKVQGSRVLQILEWESGYRDLVLGPGTKHPH